MIREEKFVMSHRPYAIELDSLDMEDFVGGRGKYWRFSFNAAWFRKDGDAIKACLGKLKGTLPEDTVGNDPTTEGILRSYRDGRYGGECFAKLDSEFTFWSEPARFDAMQARHAFLDRAIREFPLAPGRYRFGHAGPVRWDAWWCFEIMKELTK